jgi:hypothetical protein
MITVHIVVKHAPWPYGVGVGLWANDYQILSVHESKRLAEAERQRLIGAGGFPGQLRVVSKRVKGAA